MNENSVTQKYSVASERAEWERLFPNVMVGDDLLTEIEDRNLIFPFVYIALLQPSLLESGYTWQSWEVKTEGGQIVMTCNDSNGKEIEIYRMTDPGAQRPIHRDRYVLDPLTLWVIFVGPFSVILNPAAYA